MTRPHFLYVARHGQTDWNQAGRYQGQIDITLNNVGRAQAARNGMALATHLAEIGVKPSALSFVSSPLQRTRETLHHLRQACSLPIDPYRHDKRFLEASYGVWEGKTLVEAKAAFPHDAAARRANRVHFAPQGGESFAHLNERVCEGLADLRDGDVLIAHGGVIKVIWGAYLGLSLDEALSLDIRQDRIFRFCPGMIESF